MNSCVYTLHIPHRTADGAFDCEECHNVSMNVSYFFKTGDTGEHTPAHAATTISCLACHQELFSDTSGDSCVTSCHLYGTDGEINAMHVSVSPKEIGHIFVRAT